MEGKITKEVSKKIKELAIQYPQAVSIGLGKKITNGVDTGEFAIVISIPKKKKLSELTSSEIIVDNVTIENEGVVKVDIIEETIIQHLGCDAFCGNTAAGSNNAANRATNQLMQGGISFSSRNNTKTIGTLGGMVKHVETGTTVGLTNNHVSINDAFYTSDRDINNQYLNDAFPVNRVYQNAENGSNTPVSNNMGVSLRYVPIHKKSTGIWNQVDAAICSIVESRFNINTAWNQIGLESILGSTAPPFASTAELDLLLTINPRVYSSGRTTGPKGLMPECPMTISAVDALITSIGYQMQNPTQANLSDGQNSPYYVVCQFDRAIKFVKPNNDTPDSTVPGCTNPIFSGDSGSFLLAELNGTIKIIGLCYAGSSNSQGQVTTGVACRIDDVVQQLGIAAYDPDDILAGTLADPDSIIYITEPGTSDDKIRSCDSKTYWQAGFTDTLENQCV